MREESSVRIWFPWIATVIISATVFYHIRKINRASGGDYSHIGDGLAEAILVLMGALAIAVAWIIWLAAS
jgi:hypothetical protein